MTTSILRLLLLLLPVASRPLFEDSAVFERLSHFHDYGVPGTVGDPINQAAIADGTCRLVLADEGADMYPSGFAFWRNASKVTDVIATLGGVGASTAQPSFFTLTAKAALRPHCLSRDGQGPTSSRATGAGRQQCGASFDIHGLSQAAQNWYHALCAPATDPSWGGKFDPAYQPQQMALTTGFLCSLACDCAGGQGRQLSAAAMLRLARSATDARDSVCALFPWTAASGSLFANVTSATDLAERTSPLLGKTCGC